MEEYLVLAQTNEKSIGNVISQVLDNPKIFGFGELFDDKLAKSVYTLSAHICIQKAH